MKFLESFNNFDKDERINEGVGTFIIQTILSSLATLEKIKRLIKRKKQIKNLK